MVCCVKQDRNHMWSACLETAYCPNKHLLHQAWQNHIEIRKCKVYVLKLLIVQRKICFGRQDKNYIDIKKCEVHALKLLIVQRNTKQKSYRNKKMRSAYLETANCINNYLLRQARQKS